MAELIPISLFISVAAVLILRPLTKRVGGLLEVVTQERRRGLQESDAVPETSRLVTTLDRIATRMDLLEERMEYAERLYVPVRRARLERTDGDGAAAVERTDRHPVHG